MLRLERRGKALDALIKLADRGSVLISYRGTNSEGKPLYEVRFSGGNNLTVGGYLNLTEAEMIREILKGELKCQTN